MLLQFLLSLSSFSPSSSSPSPSPPPPALSLFFLLSSSSSLTHPFREQESVHLTQSIELKACSVLHVHNFH